jgi:hypothetical protein
LFYASVSTVLFLPNFVSHSETGYSGWWGSKEETFSSIAIWLLLVVNDCWCPEDCLLVLLLLVTVVDDVLENWWWWTSPVDEAIFIDEAVSLFSFSLSLNHTATLM